MFWPFNPTENCAPAPTERLVVWEKSCRGSLSITPGQLIGKLRPAVPPKSVEKRSPTHSLPLWSKLVKSFSWAKRSW